MSLSSNIIIQENSIKKSLISLSGLSTELNNVTQFNQENIWSYKNKQYVTFVNKDGRVIVAKRSINSESWITSDTGKSVNTSDLHCGSVLGIDPDGFIHLFFDTHASPTTGHYLRSAGPEDISTWTDAPQMTGMNENAITYVKCFKNKSNLFCIYRNGYAGSGQAYLNKYDYKNKIWKPLVHPFIGVDSEIRSPYFSEIGVDSLGRFHVFWTWRENIKGGWVNINICYAFSDDAGNSWAKSNGTQYTTPINYANAEVVDNIGLHGGLINDPRMDVDIQNRPHLTYYKADKKGFENYYHTWLNRGSWQIDQVTAFKSSPERKVKWSGTLSPLPLGRPSIALRGEEANILFTYPIGKGLLYAAVADYPYTAWKFSQLGSDRWLEMEINFDKLQWKDQQEFHIFASAPDRNPGEVPVYIIETKPPWLAGYGFEAVFHQKICLKAE